MRSQDRALHYSASRSENNIRPVVVSTFTIWRNATNLLSNNIGFYFSFLLFELNDSATIQQTATTIQINVTCARGDETGAKYPKTS